LGMENCDTARLLFCGLPSADSDVFESHGTEAD